MHESTSLEPVVQCFLAGQGPAFKDWWPVCAAIGSGDQHLILRKGGISEGREGFAFRYPVFALYPTQYHVEDQRVRGFAEGLSGDPTSDSDKSVSIEVLVRVERAGAIGSLASAEALGAFHVWKPSVITERFAYGEQPGLHLAVIRAYRLAQPWVFPYERRFGGCRSWIILPPADPGIFEGMVPVISDAAFEAIAAQIEASLENVEPVAWLNPWEPS